MKRFLYIALVSIVVEACTKDIDFHRNDIKPILMLNSQMTVGDTLHLVYLGVSNDVSVEAVQSGTVRCYINGSYAAEGVLDSRDDEVFTTDEKTNVTGMKASSALQTRYSFRADFKPGDIVRIEAEANGGALKAYAELTVPKAPEFQISDTLYQKDPAKPDSFDEGTYRLIINGKDFTGENSFFRIKTGYSRLDRIFNKATDTEDARHWNLEREFHYLHFEKGNDPIMNDGAPSEDLDLTGANENSFRVFTDRMFTDGDFKIAVEIPSLIPNNGPVVFEKFDSADSDTFVSVIISGITEDEYHYLKAISIYDYLDGDTSLTEPVSFPNNVEGGVGLVSVCTPAVATVKFHRTFTTSGSLYID